MFVSVIFKNSFRALLQDSTEIVAFERIVEKRLFLIASLIDTSSGFDSGSIGFGHSIQGH